MIAPKNDNNRSEPLSLRARSEAIDELTAECARRLAAWQQVDVVTSDEALAARDAYWQANSNLFFELSLFHAHWKETAR
jgi:hypothetical protein